MVRPLLKYAFDLALWGLATPLAYLIRLDVDLFGRHARACLLLTLLLLPVKAALEAALGLHRRSWRRARARDASGLAVGVAAVLVVSYGLRLLLQGEAVVPRSVPLIEALVALVALGSTRLAVRTAWEARRTRRVVGGRTRRVVVAGAGEAGLMIAEELLRHPETRLRPVGFLDDDPAKRQVRFLGLPVLGTTEDVAAVAAAHDVDELLIAIPSAAGDVVRRLVFAARAADLPHRSIPSLFEIVSGRGRVMDLREVNLDDLLRRAPVRLPAEPVAAYLAGRVVLVTGAGGSIGSEIARQVALVGPARLVLLGRGENSIFSIEQELRKAHPGLALDAVVADVRDPARLDTVFARHRPDVVFHAAAHKHVPMMEAAPEEAVVNNVGGTRHVLEAARRHGVTVVVNLSTDKAVCPSSVMGATKHVTERLVRGVAREAGPGQRFLSVRFGNVLGSRGSVVPLLREQIAGGGPVTLTHPEARRYFMTIPEAAQLVLQAGSLDANGALYILDMGPPIRILDLARDLILLSGRRPGVDVPILFGGLRPGEKLDERLAGPAERVALTPRAGVLRVEQTGADDALSADALAPLFAALPDPGGIRRALAALVPEYAPSGDGQSTSPDAVTALPGPVEAGKPF